MTTAALRSLALSSAAGALLAVLVAPAAGQTALTVERVATGLSLPLHVTAPAGDDRLFIVEQRGDIEILDNGAILGTSFLDITAKVSASGNERGLLGLAFDPDYANNGFFYVNYTQAVGHATVVERYTVSGNPNVANAASGTIILGPIAQPFSNHNGGCIQFGPDGKLYVGMGDGGSAGDPSCNAQKGTTLLGKMLRINKDGTIPADNPYISPTDGILNQIWAFGLRNPWRFSFDALTGDLYIGDVGQDVREELNFTPASSTGEENYGWKMMEGELCFGMGSCPVGTPVCNDASLHMPFRTYTHGAGKCSITGGHVYRGDAAADLQGRYWYADYCTGQVWSLEYDGNGGFVNQVEHTLNPAFEGAFSVDTVTSFGVDADGEQYIVDQGGEIFQIVPDTDLIGVGSAFPGTYGNPILWAEGGVGPGVPGAVHLRNALENRFAILFVAIQSNPVAFFGGTLVPFPFLDPPVFAATDASGNIDGAWADLGPNPSGLEIYLQFGIDDPGAAFGASLSNALRAVVP